jgi:hypothetical protein
MTTARERLKHFLALADQGPARRAVLADELADFLVDWPLECPVSMREPVLSLLEMTLREADDETRAKLATRLGCREELPLELANELFFSAPPAVRQTILQRNDRSESRATATPAAEAIKLLDAARDEKNASFNRQFSYTLHVPLYTAAAILSDATGEALAVASKGCGLNRVFFSALALLKLDGTGALAAFDGVPPRGAANLTAFWQAQRATTSRAA